MQISDNCDTCLENKKIYEYIISHRSERTSGVLDFIHIDLCDPIRSSLGGACTLSHSSTITIDNVKYTSWKIRAKLDNCQGRKIRRIQKSCRNSNGT